MEHRRAIIALGLDVHRELRDRFDASYMRRVWLIDGKIAAIGGVQGQLMSSIGFIWLVMSDGASRHPVAAAREARRQLQEVMIMKHTIMTTIVDGDEKARRFAEFLGFRPREAVEVGSSLATMAYLEAA